MISSVIKEKGKEREEKTKRKRDSLEIFAGRPRGARARAREFVEVAPSRAEASRLRSLERKW